MQNNNVFHNDLHGKYNIVSLLVLCILTAFSRWLFKANYLYEWDSVQFALSISKFDIMWHRPHPPGYIFYVFVIKAAYLLFQDANSAIVFINVLFSVGTLVIFYRLCLLFFKGKHIALLTVLMLATNPVFWFCGSTATAYVMEAFVTTLVGYLLFVSINSSQPRHWIIASFFFGVLGGFRQSAILLLAPLWLYVLHKKIHRPKELLVILTVFFVSVLLWLLPTIHNTVGLENYLHISRGLTGSNSEKLQAMFGGITNYLVTDLSNFFVWLVQGISPLGMGLIALALWLYFKKYPVGKILKNERAIFLSFWILPPALFYLAYIEKPGYLLTIIPPLLILLSWAIAKITLGIHNNTGQTFFKYSAYCSMILMFVTWFVWPSTTAIPQKINHAAFIIQPPLSDYNWDISSREIRQKDYVMGAFSDLLGKTGKYQSSTTVIFWAGGYPTWRHIMYYFPDYESYWLVDKSVSGKSAFNCEYYLAKDRIESSYSGLPFWVEGQRPMKINIRLDKNIKWIIWVLDKKIDIYTYVHNNYSDELLNLPNGQIIMITPNRYDMIDLGCFMIQ